MAKLDRIEPQDAYDQARAGNATIVCAYADEDKCERVSLEGAIPLTRLQRQESEIGKDRELVFY